MNKLVALLALFAAWSAQATVVKIEKLDNEWMLYVDDGSIVYLDDKQKEEFLSLEGFKAVKSLEDHVLSQSYFEYLDDPIKYEPTLLETQADATKLFKGLFTNYKDKSICANRAQLWTYEMWKVSQVKSMKAFLFFTHKYNVKYKHKWWYHVTPYVHVKNAEEGKFDEMAMDREFTSAPKSMEKWVDQFMENRFKCPVIAKYEEYENGQETGWCFVRKVPMYTWMPANISEGDKKGELPSDWSLGQVHAAVEEAIKRRNRDNYKNRVGLN